MHLIKPYKAKEGKQILYSLQTYIHSGVLRHLIHHYYLRLC